jgi:hypothetical protein
MILEVARVPRSESASLLPTSGVIPTLLTDFMLLQQERMVRGASTTFHVSPLAGWRSVASAADSWTISPEIVRP